MPKKLIELRTGSSKRILRKHQIIAGERRGQQTFFYRFSPLRFFLPQITILVGGYHYAVASCRIVQYESACETNNVLITLTLINYYHYYYEIIVIMLWWCRGIASNLSSYGAIIFPPMYLLGVKTTVPSLYNCSNNVRSLVLICCGKNTFTV